MSPQKNFNNYMQNPAFWVCFWMYEMCKYCVKKVYFFGFKA
jgi:hypothetical protein